MEDDQPVNDDGDDGEIDSRKLAANVPTSPVTDDASLTADNKNTIPQKEKPTIKNENTTPLHGLKAGGPETGDEEAGSSSITAIQKLSIPNSKRELAAGNKATMETGGKLSNAAKEISEKMAQLEIQKKDLEKRLKETDGRGSKAELGKQIGQLAKEMETLRKQTKESGGLMQVQLGQKTPAKGVVEEVTEGDDRDGRQAGEEKDREVEDGEAAGPGGQEESPAIPENGENSELGEDSGNKEDSKQGLQKQLKERHKNVGRFEAQIAPLQKELEDLKANQLAGKNDAGSISPEAAESASLPKALESDTEQRLEECEQRRSALEITNEGLVEMNKDCEARYTALLKTNKQTVQDLEDHLKEYSQIINEGRTSVEELKAENHEMTVKNDILHQKSMLHNQEMDEINTDLTDCMRNWKAVMEANERLANGNADLKKSTQAHEHEIAKLEAELRRAQEAITKNEADLKDQDAFIYTRGDFDAIAKAHSEALRANAEDMAICIAENKACKKRIFRLEAELNQALESASSSDESTAKPDDMEASSGDVAESEAQQEDAEAGKGLSNNTAPDAKDSKIKALLHTKADLESILADCEAHGRNLQSQVDGLKKQLGLTGVVDSTKRKGDLAERIADLEGQLQNKTDIDKERDSLGVARYQEIAQLSPPRDEAMEGPDSVSRTYTQSEQDELEACQNERVLLQTQVDELRKQISELIKENRVTVEKAAHNLQMFEALQSQMNTLKGTGEMEKNKEIRRLQDHNSELQAEINDREISIGKLRERQEELHELYDAGIDWQKELRLEAVELRRQKNTDDDQLDALETQVRETLRRLEQMEADRRAAEKRCDNEKQALSKQIAEKDQEISRLGQNNMEDLIGDLARCNEEKNHLRDQLTEAEDDLDIIIPEFEQGRRDIERLETLLGHAKSPQNSSEDPSGDLARCNEESDRLRNELTTTRADLDRCRQEHQRLETEPTRAATHRNTNIQTQPGADPPQPPNDDLTRCRAETKRLTTLLSRANMQIRAIQRAEKAIDPRAERACRERDLAFVDEVVSDLRADLHAAQADFADMQHLNTYLQEHLGQLVREIFRLLQQHLGVAPPLIAPPHNLADTEPWLCGLGERLAEVEAGLADDRPAEGPARSPVAATPGRAGGTGLGNFLASSFFFFGGRSCAACGALAAAAGDLDRTYVVRTEDFEAMRGRVDEIVWDLENRVRALERLVGRLRGAMRGVGSESDE
ncbi:hypothetical protein MMC32_002439 [Xylographa parallela]|nr:hypothetical protein [Xylographa parallela]